MPWKRIMWYFCHKVSSCSFFNIPVEIHGRHYFKNWYVSNDIHCRVTNGIAMQLDNVVVFKQSYFYRADQSFDDHIIFFSKCWIFLHSWPKEKVISSHPECLCVCRFILPTEVQVQSVYLIINEIIVHVMVFIGFINKLSIYIIQ